MRPRNPRALRLEALEDRCVLSADVVTRWNELLMQSLPGPTSPVPFARNMALVHVAVFDAVNSIDRSYTPYHADVHASRGASKEAAAAQAAHDTLVALYPGRQAVFDAALAADLAGIPTGRARQGVAVGQEVARQILALRATDGSSAAVTFTPPNTDPGTYQLTAPNNRPAANRHVADITPFAVASNSQYRPGPHPALPSPEYAADVNEVRVIGASDAETADRNHDGLPDRTPAQTQTSLNWQVGVNNHTVWNRIAQDVAAAGPTSVVENARLFALLNMALNDGLQTSYESKYHYNLWRPVTAIRAADDLNPDTDSEPGWLPLHSVAPASSPTHTPPYPAYASNASTIGGACATVLAGVFGTDAVSFQIPWARYSATGATQTYAGFREAAEEMALSRVYGGIHFRFDCVAGLEIGTNVGHHVLDNVLQPVTRPTARFVNGELSVVGTNGTDLLLVQRAGTQLVVWANGVQLGQFAGVTSIVADGRGGDDLILVVGTTIDAELYGGAGNDVLVGGGGNDRLYGEAGQDALFGLAGNDLLDGGDGDDVQFGGVGDDVLIGGQGTDWLFGGSGDDELFS